MTERYWGAVAIAADRTLEAVAEELNIFLASLTLVETDRFDEVPGFIASAEGLELALQRPPVDAEDDGHFYFDFMCEMVGLSSGNEDHFLVPEELLCAAIPWPTVETNLSSVADHPPPIAKRTPDSHTRPCKERDNWACIGTAPAEMRPCVRERSRQDQSIRSLLYSEADLPQSDRDSPSFSHDSHCRMLIIRLRLLLIQLAGANGASGSSRVGGHPARCISGRAC